MMNSNIGLTYELLSSGKTEMETTKTFAEACGAVAVVVLLNDESILIEIVSKQKSQMKLYLFSFESLNWVSDCI